MLSDTIIPDDKYVYSDKVVAYSDRGYIVRVNDLKMIKSNTEMLDSIPCGINCSENPETGKLTSSNIYSNGKFTVKTYIERAGEIDEASINTLCFVLTTNQYDDMMHEVKSSHIVPKIEIVECWYQKKLSDCTNYVYNAIKLRNLFMNELRNINDELKTTFLNMHPMHTNYGLHNDRDKLVRFVHYKDPKGNIKQYVSKNGLYPWCELVLDKKQVAILDSIFKKYPGVQNDLNPKILKRNPVVMLRDGDYIVRYHEKKLTSCCTLL